MYGIIQALITTLTRELKISHTLEILTSAFTHWYWSSITVTSDSRIRPIATHYTQCTYTYSSLTHSNLDEMSSASIDGYIYTATYLDDHSQYGMMFLLKNKSEQFRAFRAYKVWAEHHTD